MCFYTIEPPSSRSITVPAASSALSASSPPSLVRISALIIPMPMRVENLDFVCEVTLEGNPKFVCNSCACIKLWT